MNDPKPDNAEPRPVGVTLVAYYGQKPRALRAFIVRAQRMLRGEFGGAFRRYAVPQVHATIIGMEGTVDGADVVNANFRRRGERRPMQFGRMLDDVRGLEPFRVRVGGFRRREACGFESAGRHPFERSFGVLGGIAVAMGWPMDGTQATPALDALRRRLGDCGFRHKYHDAPDDVDNDFYFVLGRVDRTAIPAPRMDAATDRVRHWMAEHEPLWLDLDPTRLAVVGYRSAELPRATSTALPLTEDRPSPADLRALYGRNPA